MKKQNQEFQISQLRQDNIIYAVEAVAVNITCLTLGSLTSLIVNLELIPNQILFYSNIAIFAFGVLFTIFVLIGNLFRLKKIKRLEKKL